MQFIKTKQEHKEDRIKKEAGIKKEAEIKKEAKPKLFTIIASAVIPIKIKYQVSALDEREAVELVKKGKYNTIQIDRPRVHTQNIIEMIVYLGNTVHRLLTLRLK